MASLCARKVTLRLIPMECLPTEALKRQPPFPKVLVYEQIPPLRQPAKEPIFSAPGVAMGTTIKVCNYSRMCQACRPPQLCDCKPIPPNLPPNKRFKKRLFKIAKIALFLFAAKWFYDTGMFGDQKTTREVWNKLMEQLRNFFPSKRGCIQSKAAQYDMARITYNFKNLWNMFVDSVFCTIRSIPGAIAGIPALLMPDKKEIKITDIRSTGSKKCRCSWRKGPCEHMEGSKSRKPCRCTIWKKCEHHVERVTKERPKRKPCRCSIWKKCKHETKLVCVHDEDEIVDDKSKTKCKCSLWKPCVHEKQPKRSKDCKCSWKKQPCEHVNQETVTEEVKEEPKVQKKCRCSLWSKEPCEHEKQPKRSKDCKCSWRKQPCEHGTATEEETKRRKTCRCSIWNKEPCEHEKQPKRSKDCKCSWRKQPCEHELAEEADEKELPICP